VITRLWRGWTTTENADAYERFLLSELFPSMRSIPGFRGSHVLRRLESDEVAFVTLRVDNGNEPEKVAALERTERGEVEDGGLGIAAGA